MKNAVLDEKSALTIFGVLTAAKPGLDNYLQLERLELRSARGIYAGAALEIMNYLSRAWLVEQHGTPSSKPIATRIHSQGHVDDEHWEPPTIKLNGHIEPILRQIWPKKEKSKAGWSDDWSSLSLASQTVDSVIYSTMTSEEQEDILAGDESE